jgi:hypothetical protein
MKKAMWWFAVLALLAAAQIKTSPLFGNIAFHAEDAIDDEQYI